MKVELEIEDYNRQSGLQLKWEQGFTIEVKNEDNEMVIYSNKEGLISLARHLLMLAQDGVKEGTHIHLDKYNSLEEDSVDLVIQRL